MPFKPVDAAEYFLDKSYDSFWARKTGDVKSVRR